MKDSGGRKSITLVEQIQLGVDFPQPPGRPVFPLHGREDLAAGQALALQGHQALEHGLGEVGAIRELGCFGVMLTPSRLHCERKWRVCLDLRVLLVVEMLVCLNVDSRMEKQDRGL